MILLFSGITIGVLLMVGLAWLLDRKPKVNDHTTPLCKFGPGGDYYTTWPRQEKGNDHHDTQS